MYNFKRREELERNEQLNKTICSRLGLERDISEEAMLESGMKHKGEQNDEDRQKLTRSRGMVPHG